MTKLKKLLTALIISAMIISLSACEETEPAVSPEEPSSSSSSSEESSLSSESVPEISESSEPEIEEPEPILEPAVYLSSNEVELGSYITMRVENLDLSEYSFTDFLGYERSFIEKDGGWYCHIPVKTAAETGEYELTFTAGDYTFSEKVTVIGREFKTQYLVVNPTTLEETLEDEAVRSAFDAFYQEYRWYSTGEPLWNGEFVKPLGESWYKETTSFGTFRTFSNGKTEYHNATDMAVGGGTPIYATNSGVILFSDYLGLTGNTILIDHGFGIISWHYHLNERNVEVGETVEKGQLIGTVGTTGLSTGNHLHFGISVGGIFVDPMAMIGTEPDLDFWMVNEE